ncbi:MAG: transglutaminase-like domain-containing protein [Planctomycetota bacterium]
MSARHGQKARTRLAWYFRWPVKWAILGITVFFVNFPNIPALVRHVQRWQHPDDLVEPNAPLLAPLVEELSIELTADIAPSEALKRVERFVYRHVPYEWDWNTWGNADYLPTVTEVLTKGHEDCDGRAVVAASLLQRFGYRASLVTDFTHVWVKTDQGELMSPGKTKAVVTENGRLKLQSGALAQVPKALGYGIAVFPLLRELIVVAVLWFLLWNRGVHKFPFFLALVLLINGLLFLRIAGADHRKPDVWAQWVGVSNLVGGCVLPVWRKRQGR